MHLFQGEKRFGFVPGSVEGTVFETPYGIVGLGVNERSVVTGETFTVPERTIYTRFGDWFCWLMVAGTFGLAGVVARETRSAENRRS